MCLLAGLLGIGAGPQIGLGHSVAVPETGGLTLLFFLAGLTDGPPTACRPPGIVRASASPGAVVMIAAAQLTGTVERPKFRPLDDSA